MTYEKDDLGNRMKDCYEDRTRYMLPRRTYTIIRLDGKAFHTFTKQFEKPFDQSLINMMDDTARALCQSVQGVKFAFVQSDEISLLLTDFATPQTDAWFDGNIQKIASVSASIATAEFNRRFLLNAVTNMKGVGEVLEQLAKIRLAQFDARVFTIPQEVEVENYFIWRQNDSTRNSTSMVAQSLYKHKELQGKSQSELQELIFQKGINWNNYPGHLKRGRVIVRRGVQVNPTVTRNYWVNEVPPIFTQEREYLRNLIRGESEKEESPSAGDMYIRNGEDYLVEVLSVDSGIVSYKMAQETFKDSFR